MPVVNAFKDTINLKAPPPPGPGQLFEFKPQCHWRVESLHIRTVHRGEHWVVTVRTAAPGECIATAVSRDSHSM